MLPWNRRNIWSLGESNEVWTQNHLTGKWTLNNSSKLAKSLSFVVSTYLYGTFDCMLLSCQVSFSEWIYTLWLPECQGTPCSKQASTWHDITYRVIHRTNDCPKRSSIIWLIWLNGWVFACRVSGCGFKSAYCYLNFRYRVCFEQGVHLHSDNYRF